MASFCGRHFSHDPSNFALFKGQHGLQHPKVGWKRQGELLRKRNGEESARMLLNFCVLGGECRPISETGP
jgi:hypothetical protein